MDQDVDVTEADSNLAVAATNAAHIGNGLAIRDDGVLVPCTPAILQQPNIRPYHGDPNWTLEQRLDWLAGRTVRGTGNRTDEPNHEQAQAHVQASVPSSEEIRRRLAKLSGEKV